MAQDFERDGIDGGVRHIEFLDSPVLKDCFALRRM
jgi:hypothetical protein